MGDDGFALRRGEEVRAEAHEAAGRNLELEQGPVTTGLHADQGALAAGREFDGGADELLGDLDGEVLDGFAALAADGLVEDLRLAYLEFEALAAHRLDEHRQVENAAPVDDEGVGIEAGLHAEGQVLLEFPVEAVLYVPGGHIFPILSEEGGIVDHEEHGHRRLIDGDRRQGLRVLDVGDRVADLEALDPDHGADVAAADLVHIGLAEALEDHQLLDLRFLDHVHPLAQAHRHAGPERPAGDAADGDSADIRGIFEGGDQHLGRTLDYRRGRDLREDRIQQIGDVTRGLFPVRRHPALLRAAINRLEIKLFLRRTQVEHQFEDLLLDLVRAAVRLVHLVDHHDGLLAHFDGLVQHETGLRHAAFEGVDQQQHAVRHVQHTLDLAAEIAVSGRIDNIDFHALIGHRHVLREDGDPPLPLQVVAVEDEVAEVLRPAHQVGLVDHPVDKGRLAVVHVRDDRDVPDFHIVRLKNLQRYENLREYRKKCQRAASFAYRVLRPVSKTMPPP